MDTRDAAGPPGPICVDDSRSDSAPARRAGYWSSCLALRAQTEDTAMPTATWILSAASRKLAGGAIMRIVWDYGYHLQRFG
jgi:hypothetical protein